MMKVAPGGQGGELFGLLVSISLYRDHFLSGSLDTAPPPEKHSEDCIPPGFQPDFNELSWAADAGDSLRTEAGTEAPWHPESRWAITHAT